MQWRKQRNIRTLHETSFTEHCISCYFSLFKEADESLNFEEQILEAAKAITAATVALVKSASAAQRELVATGRVSRFKLVGA